MSKTVKVTARIPLEILDLIKSESKRTGIGVQTIAGKIMTFGFNVAMDKAEKIKAEGGENNE